MFGKGGYMVEKLGYMVGRVGTGAVPWEVVRHRLAVHHWKCSL